ncbi:PAN domain protein [Teladorsagia circumcincta]|uniref:PAN domain protein n=1 Tax=Teladorsagia circumcincta TaxID=45464 RepID=A0A2G9UTY8_TELCI|nr:PAN domain protein [Teladorsagia circumcincta]
MAIGHRLLLIAFIATTGYSQLADGTSAQCFKRITRRSIDNYPPLAEYQMESLRACSDYCIMAAGNGPLCRSFTYDNPLKTCRLYDHDGMKIPAILHPAIGIDFYKRISDEDNCKNTNLFENRLNFAKFGSFSHEHDEVQKNPRLPAEIDSESETLRDIEIPNGISDTFETMKVLKKKVSEETPVENTVPEVPSEPCLTSTGYYVVIGNEIVRPISNGGTVKGPDKDPLVCSSLNYFPLTRKCELYSILAEPHGTGSLVENPDVIYAEKFCLPESHQTCQDDEVFILHVQRSLSGIPINQTPSQSITKCLKACLDDDSCKTGVFDSTKQLCHLYKEAVSKSQDTIVDTPPGFVMIENGCAESRRTTSKKRKSEHQQLSLEASAQEGTSSEWSDCAFRVNGVRVQVREIEDGRLETRAC